MRSTGSGMGCPDWPKCFGSWVPPTEMGQLPSNYKEIYANKRAKKNERFAKYLTALGYKETANRILNDESILIEADFNVVKTWIEYINRLIGAIIGLLVLATFISSLLLRQQSKTIPTVALLTFGLVVFQGWIGSIVVSTNLLPWMITIHMFLALLIVALLIWLFAKVRGVSSFDLEKVKANRLVVVLIACMALTLVQIGIGTQVREAIDRVAQEFGERFRDQWIGALDMEFIIHRSFSWVVMISHLVLFVLLRNSVGLTKLVWLLAVVIVISIGSGIIMAYGAVPPAMQPIHLLMGTLSFGLQFLLLLRLILKERFLVHV